MCEKPEEIMPESRTCESCGREFTLGLDRPLLPAEMIFCPGCLRPYLLKED